MRSLANIFTVIMSTLQALIDVPAGHDRVRGPLFRHVWSRAAAAVIRFETLYAAWQAGTLRPPRIRAPRPTQATPPDAEAPAPARLRHRLPRRRGWLAATHFNMRNVASQLAHMLDRPDLADFIQAAPQLRRVLRPICHMLGIDPPSPWRLPPRPPRPPSPPSPPRARPARPTLAPLLRPLPAYVRAAVRAWKEKPA